MCSPLSLARATERKRKKEQMEMDTLGGTGYVDCDFILGSVAEVERLWSLVSYILPDHRKSMQPIHVEALVFLTVNESYWDKALVLEAIMALSVDTEG